MPATSNVQIVRCPNCGANNRVNESNLSQQRAPVCGRCKTQLLSAPPHPITVTDANYTAQIENSPLPVLLDLWAPWCGPCRMIAPVIEQLSKELSGRVRVGKLNVDENPRTPTRFNVQSIPTMLILKNGQEINRIVGAQSKEAILRQLQSVI